MSEEVIGEDSGDLNGMCFFYGGSFCLVKCCYRGMGFRVVSFFSFLIEVVNLNLYVRFLSIGR